MNRLPLRPRAARLRTAAMLVCALASLSLAAAPCHAAPEGQTGRASATTPASAADRASDTPAALEIQLFAGETRVLPQRHASRLAVGDGKILSAAVLDEREILLIANGPGDTMLQVWNKQGRNQRIKITVRQHDSERLARDLRELLGDMANLRARSIGDHVLVEGEGLSDAARDKIGELAKRFPQLIDFTSRVGLERMFAFDVRFVEISRSGLRDLGIDWTTQGKPLLGIGVVGDLYHDNRSGAAVSRVLGSDELSTAVRIDAERIRPFAANISLVGAFFGRLNLLAQKGDAVILAQPRLAARHRGEASFLAGGEIPIPVASATGTPGVMFREYGVRLHILDPVADESGTIRARIKTEVSSLDRSVTAMGVPGLMSRRTETEFNLRNGDTLVLSGVVQREQQSDVSALPYLGDIPVLGHLFKSKRFSDRDSELVVFITPWLLNPGEGLVDPGALALTERAAQALGAAAAPDAFEFGDRQ